MKTVLYYSDQNNKKVNRLKNKNFLFRTKIKNGYIGVDLAFMRRYDKFPEIWGGVGVMVTEPEEIIPAIKKVYASGLPGIINVQVDQENMSPVTASFRRKK